MILAEEPFFFGGKLTSQFLARTKNEENARRLRDLITSAFGSGFCFLNN